MKNRKSTKKKIVFLTIVVACMMVVISMFLVQSFPAQAASKADVSVTQSKSDSFSSIPLLMLMLPVAALAAYILEWTGSKKSSSAL